MERTEGERDLRLLVSCSECGLQFDASRLAPRDRFRCACGAVVEVPVPEPHDAAVVRCSACGATHQGDRASCAFCDSDFTLVERDLHTLCPGCMSRISDRARFCHACGLAIAPQATAGEDTDHACPACGRDRHLTSRTLGGERLTVLECGSCAGLWLGNEVFRLLEERATERQASADGRREVPAAARRREIAEAQAFYRPCAVCGRLMHRRNYGRKSAVIVDVCVSHGLWFDRGELDRVLTWVRRGGARRARAEEDRQRDERERQRRLGETEPPLLARPARGRGWADFVGWLIEILT